MKLSIRVFRAAESMADSRESSLLRVHVLAASDSEADHQFSHECSDQLQSLGYSPVDSNSAERFLVCSAEHGLSLRSGGRDGVVHIASRVARPWQVNRRDPLGRAIGRGTTEVVDATAGLGGDMLMMLMMGVRVVGIEQSPLLYMILSDRLKSTIGLNRSEHFDLHCEDSNVLLPHLVPSPQVIYLDPMFPARRKKSALPRKELVELRNLAARAETADNLFATARQIAKNRVVVKRLPESAPLAEAPDWSHDGKTVRYDVYARS